jgi:nucleoside-diphosphate-sugar epimerase
MKVLVTGATGFIGGHLVRHLLAQGHGVRALTRRRAGSEDRVAPLAEAGVELAWGEVTDLGSVRSAVQGVEAVFHLAAVRDKWGTPESLYREVNVGGTHHLLEAVAETGAERFVYCSSVGVARYPGNLAADETLPFREPSSQVFYHRTKAQAERMVLDWASSGRVPAVVVRPVITYGPLDEWGMVTRLIAMLAGGRFVPIGNGCAHVDLAYIDDVVSGMRRALEVGTSGQVYILSGTAPIEVRVLIGKICNLLGKHPPRARIPVSLAYTAGWGLEKLYAFGSRLGLDVAKHQPLITRDKIATLAVDRGFSHARASRELGYQPQVDYDEGLRRTLDWLKVMGWAYLTT